MPLFQNRSRYGNIHMWCKVKPLRSKQQFGPLCNVLKVHCHIINAAAAVCVNVLNQYVAHSEFV